MNTQLILSLAAISIYSVFCLYIGIGKAYDKKTVSTARGYFLGDGTGYFVLYFTTMATWFSTWIFMGAPGAFFSNGIGYIAAMTWQIIILMLMGTYAPRMWRIAKENNYTTPADMLEDYYDSKALRQSVGLTQLIFILPNLLAQVSGVGLAITALTNGFIPFWLSCVYAAGLVGIYVYYGGFKSQAYVDSAQGFMFFTILWGSVVILLTRPQIGGIGSLYQLMKQANENLLYYFTDQSLFWNWKNYAGFFLAQAFGGFCAPHVWQRMYAAKDGKTVVKLAGTLAPFY
ncbi:sodium:solute symporter family protein, partial [Lutispora sp.]|uniref:sodium:solute symporter family protein n=1 Tax=Lutispora sp. TaxID=2828727 RepID=UPI002B205D9F